MRVFPAVDAPKSSSGVVPVWSRDYRQRGQRNSFDKGGGCQTPGPPTRFSRASTFASNALAAGVTVFELARVMGTSVGMIEHHYGALIDGARAGIVGRLDAIEAALEEGAK